MQVVTAAEAASLIASGAFVGCAGFVGVGHAEAVTSALEERFLQTGSPRDLTLVFSAGQGDRASRGVNHFGNPGMTRRIVGGHWRSAPRLASLALANEAEAYNLPQGVITHLFRTIAAGKPGLLSRIGLNTFVDPRYGGSRLNEAYFADLRAPNRHNAWVKRVEFLGEDYLFYPSFPVDVALLRGTSVDANGNISTEEEPFHHELLSLAQAAHNSNGIVIAQVKRRVERHANLHAVKIPGILVDYVVVCEEPAKHAMTFGEQFNPTYLAAGNGRNLPKAPCQSLGIRKIVQRRAALEIARQRPRVVNLGVGMPANVGAVAHEEGIGGFTLSVEAGPIGGVPAEGFSFGASAYPEAVVDEPAQFDFYEGGGIDMAFLGLAELDRLGNVNVSKFGEKGATIIAGVGGFINITQSAKSIVFMGTLTAGGLVVEARDGRLVILSEGRTKKIVEEVTHLTFNGPYTAGLGHRVVYITERAVFEMREGRLTLVEIAPGMDLNRDVLAQCATRIAVAGDLALMDERLFRPEAMGLGANPRMT
ncbi:MAG: CoA-transferase [Burkholderiaceae bacterium]